MKKSEFENVKLIEGTYFNLDNRKNSTFVDTSLLIRDKRISSGKILSIMVRPEQANHIKLM